jgi:tetratricopeptide (TPR) repeat protein
MNLLFKLSLLFCISTASFAAIVSKPVYLQLKKVDYLLTQKSYSVAEKLLQHALKKGRTRYEKAVLLRSLSSVYAAQKSYPAAIQQLNKALALKSLPYVATQKAQLILGQFYLANQQQDKALVLLTAWLQRNPNPQPKTAMLLANLFSQRQHYKQALALVKKATSASIDPPKAWTDLQLALSYKVKDYQAAIMVLKAQLKKEPDHKPHWQQLSTAYHNNKNYHQAASIKHLAYQRGFLETDSERIELAQLFLYANNPYQAAKFLQQQLTDKRLPENAENLALLGHAWLTAKELVLAEKTLESALKLNPTALIYENLATCYSRQKNWQSALIAFNKALVLGQFEQIGESQLLLGITHYHLKNITKAELAFEQALIHKESTVSAQKWLTYLKNNRANSVK